MKFPFMHAIIKKISASIGDVRKAVWAIYKYEDNIFTEAYREPQQTANHE